MIFLCNTPHINWLGLKSGCNDCSPGPIVTFAGFRIEKVSGIPDCNFLSAWVNNIMWIPVLCIEMCLCNVVVNSAVVILMVC